MDWLLARRPLPVSHAHGCRAHGGGWRTKLPGCAPVSLYLGPRRPDLVPGSPPWPGVGGAGIGMHGAEPEEQGRRRSSASAWSGVRRRASGRSCGSRKWHGTEVARWRTTAAPGSHERTRRMRSAEKVAGMWEKLRWEEAARSFEQTGERHVPRGRGAGWKQHLGPFDEYRVEHRICSIVDEWEAVEPGAGPKGIANHWYSKL